MTFRVASARVRAGGDDFRALCEASQTSGVPSAAAVGVAAVLRRISNGALHDAVTRGSDFADGRGFTSLSGGDGVAGSAADGRVTIPQALRISGATNLGGVTQFAGSGATSALVVELTETRSNASTISVVGVAVGSALLASSIPLARSLSKAVAFSGELRASLFASLSSIVEATSRISGTSRSGVGR